MKQSRRSSISSRLDWTSFVEYIRWEFNALLWICLIGITWLLAARLYHVLVIKFSNPAKPIPPRPSFLSDCRLHMRADDNDAFLMELQKNYGSVVNLWSTETQLLVSITEPTLINKVLLKDEDKLPTMELSLYIDEEGKASARI